MDTLTFISSIVRSLAWPAVVMFFLWLTRNSLGDLLDRLQELALPGGGKAKFGKVLKEAGRTAAKLEADPRVITPRIVATTGTAIGEATAQGVGRALQPKPKTIQHDLQAIAKTKTKVTAELSSAEKPKTIMGTSWTLTTSSGKAYAFDVRATETPREGVIESFKALERILLQVAVETGVISIEML